jgi:predicted protein tyrosine phosphatase
MWIENVGAFEVSQGWHHDAGPNSMLIQIGDDATMHPTPKCSFKEVHQFEFLDIDDDDQATDPNMFISEDQAMQLVKLLQHALDNRMNVVVHCFAGVCRSGAVATVGDHMGFMLVDGFRWPNKRVLRMMMAELGDVNFISKPDNQ